MLENILRHNDIHVPDQARQVLGEARDDLSSKGHSFQLNIENAKTRQEHRRIHLRRSSRSHQAQVPEPRASLPESEEAVVIVERAPNSSHGKQAIGTAIHQATVGQFDQATVGMDFVLTYVSHLCSPSR